MKNRRSRYTTITVAATRKLTNRKVLDKSKTPLLLIYTPTSLPLPFPPPFCTKVAYSQSKNDISFRWNLETFEPFALEARDTAVLCVCTLNRQCFDCPINVSRQLQYPKITKIHFTV